MMKTETAIIAILLAWAAVMPLVRAEIVHGPCNGYDYTPKPLIGDRASRAQKNIITEPLSELHDFMSKDGKTVRGKIRDCSPKSETVTIAKENGKTFRANLNDFSKADQDYVREWHLINEFCTKFHCKISPKKDKSGSGVELLVWKPGESSKKIVFGISLENRSGLGTLA